MNEQDQRTTALKKWAEATVASLRSWWIQNWWLYLTFLWISSALATAVPFGLALLLYVEEPTRTTINLITLACPCLSSVLFIIMHVIRLRERAIVHRDLYEDLRLSLAEWLDGKIGDEDFVSAAEKTKEMLKQEGRLV